MARQRSASNSQKMLPTGGPGNTPPVPPPASPNDPNPPMGVLMFLRGGGEAEGIKHAQNMIGHRTVNRSGDGSQLPGSSHQNERDQLAFFPRLGVAAAYLDPDQMRHLRATDIANGPLENFFDLPDLPVEREITSPTAAPVRPESHFRDYLRGHRDAVNHLAELAGLGDQQSGEVTRQAVDSGDFRDDARGTWGLHATGVLNSRYTGRGVRVAALVDGLNVSHPDWNHRYIVAKSFVAGETATTGGQSGTHYLGTSVGTAHPCSGPRYGCAPDAVPYVAKVLSSQGAGSRMSILAGIDWAISNNCRIVLLPISTGTQSPDNLFEAIGRRAAEKGSLLIAGAGNNAQRQRQNFGFVENPAACLSIMGVGTIDEKLHPASFTPRGSTAGAIDLVAPGVNLRSSVPGASPYITWSGSATAAAYVAGIAALWAEALPNASPKELWRTLVANARPLSFPVLDIGAGLVQAP